MDQSFQSLVAVCLRGLKANLNREVVIDRSGLGRRVYTASDILVGASLLAKQLRKLPNERIGIILPPCGANYVANMAVLLAGKKVTNLNFIVSEKSARAALQKAQITTVVTSKTLQAKFKDYPWHTVEVLALEDFFQNKTFNFIVRAVGAAIELRMLPVDALLKKWGLEGVNANDEASLLFSSGSTGLPKGVPLSHKNLLTNLQQIESIDLLPDGIKVLAYLPFFHSFGQTTTLWYVLSHPVTAVTYPTPLEPAAIGRVVREESVNILIGTASFYRLYMRGVPREDFASLSCVVAGAEKTPKGLHAAWEKQFGSRYFEGYGLTETSPVAGVNLANAYRLGTIGKLVPGMRARVVDPSTREVYAEFDRRGVIELKGDNVFGGYLDDPELNAEVFSADGWFHTGDLGSLSEDGFLTVDGRLRRFSKLAGEMVPHGAVEEAIAKVFGWDDRLPVVVTGRRDAQKGESLVILSEIDLDIDDLRSRLQNEGLPNLWIPKQLKRIEQIPMLPTGKLDLAVVETLANQL